MFRNFTKHWNQELIKLTKVYGPVFTLWIGPLPFVFICDLDNCREAFNKIEFTGRPNTLFGKKLFLLLNNIALTETKQLLPWLS